MNNYEKRHMEQGKQKDEPIKTFKKSRLLALVHEALLVLGFVPGAAIPPHAVIPRVIFKPSKSTNQLHYPTNIDLRLTT
jgi:hypothetical protein